MICLSDDTGPFCKCLTAVWHATVVFNIPKASLCYSHHVASCLHSSAPLEPDQVNVSCALLPTVTPNPWLTSLFLSLQISGESPVFRSSVQSCWCHLGKKGLVVMYKLGDRFSGSRIGIFTLFKSNLWPRFQFLRGLPLFKGSLKYGFDIT